MTGVPSKEAGAPGLLNCSPPMYRLPDSTRLLELVQLMEGRKVLVLADLVADVFITGTPKRISREAPVLILTLDDESLVPGGGANALANVAALGGRPVPLGVVGDDVHGRGLLEALADRSIDTAAVLVRSDYRTPTKTRILGGARHSIKQQIVRYDVEDQVELGDGDLETMFDAIRSAAADLRVAVVSDYGYGAVSSFPMDRLRSALPDGCLVLCDSRHRLPELSGLDGATPNEEEAEAILGESLGSEPAEVAAAVQRLRRQLDLNFILVTRGSTGMVLATTEGTALLPTHGSDQVADVTGAGDTVIGTFALAIAAGGSPLEAALLANYAGGEVVLKMGTATLTAEELDHAVRIDPLPLEELLWVAL